MTDWIAAGRKAWQTRQDNDARRVIALYRAVFALPGKDVSRARAIRALVAAGGTVVCDFHGGGASAERELAAGLRPISVDNGSFLPMDGDKKVSKKRLQRALQVAGRDSGYQTHYGEAIDVVAQTDCGFYDFCGPPTDALRALGPASKHHLADVVTLGTSHDIYLGDLLEKKERLTPEERKGIYAYLLETWFDKKVRVICEYRRNGHPFWTFLIGQDVGRIRIHPTSSEYAKLDPVFHEYRKAQSREYARGYRSDPAYRALINERARLLRADPIKGPLIRKRKVANYHRRRSEDPIFDEKERAAARERGRRVSADPVRRQQRLEYHRAYAAKRKGSMKP
jgi:hypothetical protein